jgi:hypothetical protein
MSEESNGARGRRFGPIQLVLGLGGIAAAIASLYGLYQIINPPPSPTAGGEFSDINVDSGSGLVYVNFEAEIAGYSGQQCEVRWTLYDADAQALFPEPEYQDQHATYITPSRDKDEGTDQFKVPDPGRSGNYYVRLKLFPPEESGENLALDVEDSEYFVSGSSSSGQDLGKQETNLQKEETTQTSDSSGTAPPDEDIQNLNTTPSEASEGVVVVSPEFNAAAATAEEAAAINAAIDYYQYAEIGDYSSTYDLLSSESQSRYTLDEWVAANTALDSAAGEFVVTDAYAYDLGLGVPTYAVAVTVYADGTSFNRMTYFIYEASSWRHHLTSEEVNMFDDALY